MRTTYPDKALWETEAMDAAEVELLKREWAGKRVETRPGSPWAARFTGRTGTVITVNMNGRALVRFDGNVDISWYDIPLEGLRSVAAPAPPEELAPVPWGGPPITSATKPKIEGTLAGPPSAAPDKPKPKSILELARQQGAAKGK